MLKKLITVAALAVATLTGGVAAASGVAHASTTGCTQGVYAGYCGTQTDAADSPLSWDVYRTIARPGNKIIGWPNSGTDKATDFFTFAYDGGSGKVFEYAPHGMASGLCVTEPARDAGLVLEVCTGQAYQQFVASQVGDSGTYTWANGATGDIVTVNGLRGQLTGDNPGGTPSSSQEFTFSG